MEKGWTIILMISFNILFRDSKWNKAVSMLDAEKTLSIHEGTD
jgi:hypothetical protein